MTELLHDISDPVERIRWLVHGERGAETFVYVIAAAPVIKNGTPIKVGFSKAPHQRLGELQLAHWKTLYLVCYVPGTRTLEATLHQAFEPRRLRGEWYSATRATQNVVAMLVDEMGEVNAA